MKFEIVKNVEDACRCDELLTKLICSESKYDINLKDNYVVKDYFSKLYENDFNVIYVAKNDEDLIIGYAYCKITTIDDGPYKSHIALLDGVYVENEYRHQGIASKLIDECKKWSKQVGAIFFEINVMTANKGALGLYEKIGFEEVEKKMRLSL